MVAQDCEGLFILWESKPQHQVTTAKMAWFWFTERWVIQGENQSLKTNLSAHTHTGHGCLHAPWVCFLNQSSSGFRCPLAQDSNSNSRFSWLLSPPSLCQSPGLAQARKVALGGGGILGLGSVLVPLSLLSFLPLSGTPGSGLLRRHCYPRVGARPLASWPGPCPGLREGAPRNLPAA